MKEILKSQETERKERGFDDSDSEDEDLETLTNFFEKSKEKKPEKEEVKPKIEEEEEESENSLDISASDFAVKASELSKIEEGDEDDPFSSFDQPVKRRNGLQDTNESGVVVYGSVEITKSDDDDDDDFEDESEEEDKESVIVQDEEHEPHTKPQPSMPSPRRQDVSSDINFDDFEDVMVPSKLMDDVDLSPSKLMDDVDLSDDDTNNVIKKATDIARHAATHALKISEHARCDVEDLIAVRQSFQEKKEEKTVPSRAIKQRTKCLRNSDCRCEQCVLSIQGQQNFFAEMERLRT